MSSIVSRIIQAETGIPPIDLLHHHDGQGGDVAKQIAETALTAVLVGVAEDQVQHLVNGLDANTFALLAQAVLLRNQREAMKSVTSGH